MSIHTVVTIVLILLLLAVLGYKITRRNKQAADHYCDTNDDLYEVCDTAVDSSKSGEFPVDDENV